MNELIRRKDYDRLVARGVRELQSGYVQLGILRMKTRKLRKGELPPELAEKLRRMDPYEQWLERQRKRIFATLPAPAKAVR